MYKPYIQSNKTATCEMIFWQSTTIASNWIVDRASKTKFFLNLMMIYKFSSWLLPFYNVHFSVVDAAYIANDGNISFRIVALYFDPPWIYKDRPLSGVWLFFRIELWARSGSVNRFVADEVEVIPTRGTLHRGSRYRTKKPFKTVLPDMIGWILTLFFTILLPIFETVTGNHCKCVG